MSEFASGGKVTPKPLLVGEAVADCLVAARGRLADLAVAAALEGDPPIGGVYAWSPPWFCAEVCEDSRRRAHAGEPGFVCGCPECRAKRTTV